MTENNFLKRVLATLFNRCHDCNTKKILDEQYLKHLGMEAWYCPNCEKGNDE